MKNKIFLMISYDQLSKLKSKHVKIIMNMGFMPHEFFSPVFFKNFSNAGLGSNLYYTYFPPIISYSYSKVKLTEKNKQDLKDILITLYNKGIYPMNIKKDDIYIAADGNILFFITDGLSSKNYALKSIATESFIMKRISNFINSL